MSAGFRPVVMSLKGATAAQKSELEVRYAEELIQRLGGLGAVEACYRAWLAHSGKGRDAPIDSLKEAMRWESAHAWATLAALEGCGDEMGQPFFVIHLGKQG